jgi:hypothetical protein
VPATIRGAKLTPSSHSCPLMVCLRRRLRSVSPGSVPEHLACCCGAPRARCCCCSEVQSLLALAAGLGLNDPMRCVEEQVVAAAGNVEATAQALRQQAADQGCTPAETPPPASVWGKPRPQSEVWLAAWCGCLGCGAKFCCCEQASLASSTRVGDPLQAMLQCNGLTH